MYKLIQYVASDRVGKSSLARKISYETGAQIFHWGAPDYSAPTPLTRFEPLLAPTTTVTVSDRSYLEYSVHDFMLSGLTHDPADIRCLIHNFERKLSQVYDSVEIQVLEKPWCKEMLRRHLNEINSLNNGTLAPWYKDLLIEQRRKHHDEFYRLMEPMLALTRFNVTYRLVGSELDSPCQKDSSYY